MEFDGILQWAEFVKFFRKFGIVSDALTMEAKWHLLTVKARNLKNLQMRLDVGLDRANLTGLDLGCIEAKFCK